MNIKFDPKALLTKLTGLLGFIKRYVVFIFVLVMLMIFSFFVFRINQFSRTEPTEDAINEKLQTVQRPKIDKSVLDKIQQLQDQNIQVQSLFEHARENPFNE